MKVSFSLLLRVVTSGKESFRTWVLPIPQSFPTMENPAFIPALSPAYLARIWQFPLKLGNEKKENQNFTPEVPEFQ